MSLCVVTYINEVVITNQYTVPWLCHFNGEEILLALEGNILAMEHSKT